MTSTPNPLDRSEASTTTPFVAPLGFTCPGEIPVAHTEGAVALDLSAFVPDLVAAVLRAQAQGARTAVEITARVMRSDRHLPHITTDTAERLGRDLLAAAIDAES